MKIVTIHVYLLDEAVDTWYPSVLNISVVIVIEYSTKRLKTLCGSLERAILFVAGSRSSGAVQCLLMPW